MSYLILLCKSVFSLFGGILEANPNCPLCSKPKGNLGIIEKQRGFYISINIWLDRRSVPS